MPASDYIGKTFVVTFAHYTATDVAFTWKNPGEICIIIDAYKERDSFAWLCVYSDGPVRIYAGHDEAGALDSWLREIK